MAEKHKPARKVVKAAAKAMKRPKTMTLKTIKSISARILDDQKNDPLPHAEIRHYKKVTRKAPRTAKKAVRRSSVRGRRRG